MTKKESNSNKILLIMLIAPIIILGIALAIINIADLKIKPINYLHKPVALKPSEK